MIGHGWGKRRRGAAFAAMSLLATSGCGGYTETEADKDLRGIEMTKPAVVKVVESYGCDITKGGQKVDHMAYIASGSGYFFNPDGWVMTNAHVVADLSKSGDDIANDIARALSKQLGRSVPDLVAAGIRLANCNASAKVYVQTGKGYVAQVLTVGAAIGTTSEGAHGSYGRDFAILKIEVTNAPTLPLGSSTTVREQEKILVLGYPAAADMEKGVFDEKSDYQPTGSPGQITRIVTGSDGIPNFQTNAPTFHGNSGGPALNDKGEVIGLLTFHPVEHGDQLQGFHYLVPIDTGKEYIHKAGTDAKSGPTDAKWKEAVDHYIKHEYSAAEKVLAEVKRLFPEHAEADRLTKICVDEIAAGHDRAGFGAGAWIGIALGLLLVAGGGVGFFLFQKKQRGSPAPAPRVAVIMTPSPQQGLAGAATHLAGGMPPGYGPPQTVQQPYQPPGIGASPYGPPPALPMNPNVPLAKRGTEVFQGTAAKLLCLSGPLQGREFPIGPGLLLGREGPTVQVAIPDPQVSTEHVWVGPFNGRIVARDMGSTNGTYLNQQMNQRIQQVELNEADVLTLGLKGTVRFAFKSA